MMNYLDIHETSDDPVDKIICEKLTSIFCKKYILVGDDKTCLPKKILEYADDIKNLDIRDDDVIINSFMKSGTIWLSELVWMIKSNLDYKGAEADTHERVPYLELSALVDFTEYAKIRGKIAPDYCKAPVDVFKNMTDPRFMKTHLPFPLWPDKLKNFSTKSKILYIMRNPKDVCVSLYHHGKVLEGWTCTLDELAKIFLSDKVLYGPYWKHLSGILQVKNHPNVMVLKYEELKSDMRGIILRVAKFLGKELSDGQVEELLKHLSFESMRNNKSTNFQHVIESKMKIRSNVDGAFIRRGEVGSYKDEMSEETIAKFDMWMQENCVNTLLEGIY